MLPLLLMLLLLLPHMMQLSSNSAIISLGSTGSGPRPRRRAPITTTTTTTTTTITHGKQYATTRVVQQLPHMLTRQPHSRTPTGPTCRTLHGQVQEMQGPIC
jgi:hypothetical protein